jgi:hypothetical protein
MVGLRYPYGGCERQSDDFVRPRSLPCPIVSALLRGFAAPGVCEASALLAPFRFWLRRSGPPRKQLLVLGAAPTRFPVPDTNGQNRRNVCTSTELP